MAPDDLTETIEDAAAEPESASADGQAVKQRSIAELIAADKYLAGKTSAQTDPRVGFTRVKIVPPGTV